MFGSLNYTYRGVHDTSRRKSASSSISGNASAPRSCTGLNILYAHAHQARGNGPYRGPLRVQPSSVKPRKADRDVFVLRDSKTEESYWARALRGVNIKELAWVNLAQTASRVRAYRVYV